MRAFAVLAVLLAACTSPKPLSFGERQPLSIVTAAGTTDQFSVEVATTPKQLWTGLRWRREMAPDQGMLFDLGVKQTTYFTMSNTILPLDMLFIDSDGKILKIEAKTKPGKAGPFNSDYAVLGVLELNAGTTERLGIHVGDYVRHPMFKAR